MMAKIGYNVMGAMVGCISNVQMFKLKRINLRHVLASNVQNARNEKVRKSGHQEEGRLIQRNDYQLTSDITFQIKQFEILQNLMRKIQTRGGHRQPFYHESEQNCSQVFPGDIIRPPTSHPYSGYKSKKSESQMRSKYCPNYFLESKLEANLKQLKNNLKSCHYIDRLPANFKLMMNQLRVYAKNVSDANADCNVKSNDLDSIVQSLAKMIYEVIREKSQLLRSKEQIEKYAESLGTKVQELEKKYCKSQILAQCKKTSRRFDSYNCVDQQIMLENCKLGELNTKYMARISELQNKKEQKSSFLPSNNKENQTRADTQLLRCQSRMAYLDMKLQSATIRQAQLTQQNQKLSQEIERLRLRLEKVENQCARNSEKMMQWRQRAQMQRQDGEIHISRQQFLLYSLKKLKENNKNLLNKFLTLYKSDDKIQKKDLIMQSPNFQFEMDIFKNIRTMYEKSKAEKPFTHNQVHKNQLGLQIQEVSLELDYQNYKKSDSFDVSHLRYFRPTFFSFLQETANPDIVASRNKSSNCVSRVFIQILRAIMTSKKNEFMLADCPEKYTRFPQFVYAWFEKYYFNTEKNSICALQPFMQKPVTQQLFYRDLMNVKLDQSWQIITFRQFILEQLSLEQLYFYLMCQSLLYSRGGITKQIEYMGDFCILVQYTAAKSVIDITLNDFQSWNIAFLTSKLREKIVMKKNKEYIQAGFFLRCLVEYYRIERSNRYRYISKLCSEFKDSKKGGLRFSSFMSVINKFTEISTETKLKLYRDCYCLTKGAITPESIFIVCSQQMIFLKHLKIKSFYRMPKILQKPSKLSSITQQNQQQAQPPSSHKPKPQLLCLHPPDPYLYEIVGGFNRVLNIQNNIVKRIESLGVNEFNNEISLIIRALDQKNSQLGTNILKCKHFLHYFSNSIQIIRRITFYNFYQLLQQQTKKKSSNFWIQINDEDLGEIFSEDIKSTFRAYEKINELRKWKNKIYQFRINHAAKKIQKQFKKKFIQPYLQIYQYFCHEVKQVKEDNGDGREGREQRDGVGNSSKIK